MKQIQETEHNPLNSFSHARDKPIISAWNSGDQVGDAKAFHDLSWWCVVMLDLYEGVELACAESQQSGVCMSQPVIFKLKLSKRQIIVKMNLLYCALHALCKAHAVQDISYLINIDASKPTLETNSK